MAQEWTHEEALRLLTAIIVDPRCSESLLENIPESDPETRKLANLLFNLRSQIKALASGDLRHASGGYGYSIGMLKSLGANLRHLTWNLTNIANGEYVETDPFMGDFSASFNTLSDELREKSNELEGLIDKYKTLSHIDPLTKLPNRRAFYEEALRELHRAFRTARPLTLIMADVDHFKAINDTYGHKVGDIVLQKVAARFQIALRATDMCSRFGGEEFLMLLPETGENGARHVVARLLEGCTGKPFLVGKSALRVTVSFGVALLKADPQESAEIQLDTTIARADAALYLAKNSGRNRACYDFETQIVMDITE